MSQVISKNDFKYKIVEQSIDSSIIEFSRSRNFEKAAKIAHDFSVKSYRKGNIIKAIKYALIEVQSFEKGGLINDNYINALYNVGRFYYKNEEVTKAIPYYEKILSINFDDYISARSYGELARCFRRKGDFFRAIFFFEKGIGMLCKMKKYRSLYSQLINYGITLDQIKDLESLLKSKEILKKAEVLYLSKENVRNGKKPYSLYSSLANHYNNQQTLNFEKARFYYLKNLSIALAHQDSIIISSSYNNMGELYLNKNKDSALYFLKKALPFSKIKSSSRLNTFKNLSIFYMKKNDFDKSLFCIQKAIQSYTKVSSKFNSNPSNSDLIEADEKKYLLDVLNLKARILFNYGLSENRKEFFIQTIKVVKVVNELISIINSNSREEFSKLFWRREASQAYLYGAYASHLLGDTDKAFSFMEKNKALLLSEGVLKNTEFANLPKHISDEETKRKKQIYRLENLLSKDEDNAILQDSLFMAKRSHERYIDSLKVDYPKYFARKINVDQIPLGQVQSELNGNEAIVSFIWSDFDSDRELAIGLVATKDTSISFEVEHVEKLKEKLKAYKSFISKPFETKSDQQVFQKVAYELYELLFPTEELRGLIQGKNLMIIPDGELQNIPFESFITKENTSEYLIYNGDINYAYSYSFLKHNEKVNRETTNSFVGYSPGEFTSLSLSTLKNTKEELNEINIELNGVIKLQDTATKEDFLQNTSQSQIIHLATHANAGANPWIAFSNDKLELHELYTYKNNADLVTLSACNTSLGDMAKGEGVLSLARGFFYSGSKSVVSSLWNVNDQSTSDIMTNFYKNLKEGQTKSEAINNAKRTYLSNHSLSEQSPYYWSSFILIGDTGTLEMPSNLYLYYIGIAIVFLVILIFRKKIKIFG
jgi:CHAT domain-containing protein